MRLARQRKLDVSHNSSPFYANSGSAYEEQGILVDSVCPFRPEGDSIKHAWGDCIWYKCRVVYASNGDAWVGSLWRTFGFRGL